MLDRRARRAGPRRRGRLRCRALADDDAVHRARRAGEGDGRLRLRRLRRREHRRAARRRADRRRSAGTGSSSSTSRSACSSASSPLARCRRAAVPAGDRRLDSAGAVTVTASLMLAVYAIVNGNETGWTSPQTLGLLGAAAVLFASSSSSSRGSHVPLDAARPLPAAQRRVRERRRRPLGGRDVRLVLPLRALPPARARLQPARGRPRLPAGQPDHGSVLGRSLGQARDALRDPAAARGRAQPGGAGAPALRPRAGGRNLRRRRPPEHDPPRHRRRDGLQPGAAGRDERRRARARPVSRPASSTPRS